MAQNGVTGAWRSFWHAMTSKDRHATHDSPSRIGASLVRPRHDPLTSVISSSDEASMNLASSVDRDEAPAASHFYGSAAASSTPGSPYTPGMRSTMQRRESQETTKNGTSAEVQMQTFSDGLPPPPPVKHSWKRIDRWLEDNYEELDDNMGEPCTQNDINELEHELDCTLPQDVRDSLQVHDGQERGGNPTGVIFSAMLLDCEEIVDEWKQWRRVNEEYLSAPTVHVDSSHTKPFTDSGESSSNAPAPPSSNGSSSSTWQEDLLAKQDSQPDHAVQKVYAHPAWIPLVRDWGGNNIAVDLAPGPAGKWGQVILMGRDYDCKYVIARSWAAFLATFADDITSRKTFIVEESGELKLREFKGQIEPGYLDILRWRADQKYGRKPPRRRQGPPHDMRINPNVPAVASRASPYVDQDRGRSPQRFSGKSISTQSPRGTISSPLARVAEEVASSNTAAAATIPPAGATAEPEVEPLIGLDTPRGSVIEGNSKIKDFASAAKLNDTVGDNDENEAPNHGISGLAVKNSEPGHKRTPTAEGMKTVDI